MVKRKTPARHKVTRNGKTFWRGKGTKRRVDFRVYHPQGNEFSSGTLHSDEPLSEIKKKLLSESMKGTPLKKLGYVASAKSVPITRSKARVKSAGMGNTQAVLKRALKDPYTRSNVKRLKNGKLAYKL